MKLKKSTRLLFVSLLVVMLAMNEIKAKFSFKDLFKLRGVDFNYKNVAGFTPLTIPTNTFGKEQIDKYNSCSEAWNDMFYWLVLFYGDWYGNHGANTVAYAFWQYGWQKAP